MGEALAPLRAEGFAVVGSGLTFHNMRAFFSSSPAVVASAEVGPMLGCSHSSFPFTLALASADWLPYTSAACFALQLVHSALPRLTPRSYCAGL